MWPLHPVITLSLSPRRLLFCPLLFLNPPLPSPLSEATFPAPSNPFNGFPLCVCSMHPKVFPITNYAALHNYHVQVIPTQAGQNINFMEEYLESLFGEKTPYTCFIFA